MIRFIFLLILLPLGVLAQTGGKHAYPFLDLPQNARAGGQGGDLINVYDDDVSLGVLNPAAFNPEMDNVLGINQSLLSGGLYHGMLVYGKHFSNIGTGAVHLRYASYGVMKRMNEEGEELGKFSAGDFAVGASMGRVLNPNFSIGANVNLIWSQLESYNSFGVSVDFAGMFQSKDKLLNVSAVVRNIGVQLKTYTKKTRAPLPINAMLGVAYRLEHAPFRFSVIMHHLNVWDLTYFDPNQKSKTDPLTGELIPPKRAKFGEKFGRHFIVQVESYIGKVVVLRMGFDYNQRKEMLVPNRPGIGGFSFGAGINLKRFSIDYGFNAYSSAGYHNMLTFRTNFSKWRRTSAGPIQGNPSF